MINKLIWLGMAFMCLSLGANAQLEVKRNFQAAYDQETRSMDGAPGAKYWQNRSDYKIQASIDPATRELKGSETITYTNNSPDSLGSIVIRLYQDIFKKGNPRDRSVKADDLTDGTQISRLSLNGQEADLSKVSGVPARYSRGPKAQLTRYGTNLYVQLNEKIGTGQQVEVEIDWSFIIPQDSRMRMGSYGPSSFFVAYWYPQIAVYDDIDGWDKTNYTGTVEMYNDFGDFDVELTMPDSVMVWATGLLQNPEEVLAKEQAKRFKKAQTSDEVVRIVTAEDQEKGKFLKKNGQNTWKFSAQYVPDFAFAVSDFYLWDATSIEVEKGRRVLVDAAYRPDADFYDQAAEIARAVVEDLSENLPGVPYPFPAVTVFNGSGGMEFPMIVNDGRVTSRFGLITLTYHEIAHTYFPFLMGINERKYAWMDEGWAQMLPYDLAFKLEPDGPNAMRWVTMSYERTAGGSMELPLMTPTVFTAVSGYGVHAYSKPALAYTFLQDLMGEKQFAKAVQHYVENWRGKHPIPHDFFNSMEASYGKDLDWFWQPWFFEALVPDLGFESVALSGNSAKLTIENKGGMPLPVHLTFVLADGSVEERHESPEVWKEKDSINLKFKFDQPVKQVALGGPTIPDADRSDNLHQVEVR